MFKSLFDSNEKQIRNLSGVVGKINSFEADISKLSQEELRDKTFAWKTELAKLSDEDKKRYLDQILPEAFAVVREVGKRVLNMRHFDVQLIAGIVLHQGKIAEQKTGEGKTLTATLPLYLNSLTGKGVHLVTPNDYLSRHGAGWMAPLFDYLGVSVGVIMQERAFVYDPSFEGQEFEDAYAIRLKESSRKEAYKCDVVYGTNHEFGFDYLRDNMCGTLDELVQTNARGDYGAHNFAIVDEVDSILIDMARTPLIISASDAKPSERYHEANRIIKALAKGTDYDVEEKFRNVTLTDLGIRRVERLLGIQNLYEEDFEMVHLMEQALTAHALYEKDRDYIVKDGKVVIIDQFTGRQLPNNRYSHGLHQAIEAKETVEIQEESKTLAEISYQNYFRMYEKLAGMTGTAVTEAEEFYKIYKLDVVSIPTNKPNVRKDFNDVIYKTESIKFRAVADEIAERHKQGQPVLVGTTSVEKSEVLHELLNRKKIPHEILNAKNHEREALIVAQAGKKGAVTISTNMAGRGVDILLGGDPPDLEDQEGVKQAGGLFVIGTERHESRRIDNQLRGRAGRQGDPGSSKFYVSLQDDLMRIFGGDRVKKMMDNFGFEEDVPLEAGIISRAIENAQKRVEGLNFDSRKHVVEMDDVMNVHREVIYKLRNMVLRLQTLDEETESWFVRKLEENEVISYDDWNKRLESVGREAWLNIASRLSLPVIDVLWMGHLVDMEQVRIGIDLRAYANRDTKVEYKKEGHERFELLVQEVFAQIGERLLRVNVSAPLDFSRSSYSLSRAGVTYQHSELETGVSDEAAYVGTAGRGGAAGGAPTPRFVDALGRELKVLKVSETKDKVGRNDPCPCGSGKKYKNCHGRTV